MCLCNPNIRTPYCGKFGCRQEDTKLGSIDSNVEVYDLNTTNRSFIEMAVKLKQLGIKNNKFMLGIKNQHLIGIDPFTPYLGKSYQSMVIDECIRNPWYFLRECIRVLDDEASGIRGYNKFKLNMANLSMLFSYINNINTAVVAPRRNFITKSAAAIILWAGMFRNIKSELVTDESISSLIALLPDYLRMMLEPKSQDKILVRSTNSIISIKSTQIHPHGQTRLTDFSSNNLSAVIIDGHSIAKRRKTDSAFWVDHIFDWSKGSMETYVSNNSSSSVLKALYIQFDFARLDRDSQWFSNMLGIIGNPDRIDRDILLIDKIDPLSAEI